MQAATTSGGENASSASYRQTIVVGIISGLLNSSTYLNNVGLLRTARLADGQPCTFDVECEGGHCCSNACSSSACPVPPSGDEGGSSGGVESSGGGGMMNLSALYAKQEAETNFTLSPELLRIHLFLGETNTSEMLIENTGNRALNVSLRVDTVEEFLELSPLLVEGLAIDESATVDATATGTRFGSYFGTVVATAGGVNRTTDVILEIESEALFDVKLDIPQSFKFLSSQEKPRAQITMFNIGSTPSSVVATYLIKDAKGRVYSEESEEFSVEKERSYVHEFSTTELPLGKYLAVVEVRYQDAFAVSSDIFSVVDKETFTLIAPTGRNITFFISLLVLSGIAYIAITYFMPRTKGKRKKSRK